MREDPAAFREMIFVGLRALEEAGTKSAARGQQENSGQVSAGEPVRHASQTAAHEVQLATYRAFESAANNELEKSVGGAIDRAIAQAIPNISKPSALGQAGAQPFEAQGKHAAPLQARLQAAIREDIEAALKADRQLGEQVAQLLASRHFDDTTRAQVVRLINDRAQQLVPGAARRVINDWTQTTLAAHRAKTQRAAIPGERSDLAPADVSGGISPLRSGKTSRTSGPSGSAQGKRNDSTPRAGARVDYRKLSDEQILEL
jgi:hypothetical protein